MKEQQEKYNLPTGWKVVKLIDLDNLPDPDVLIDDIIENIESALANFRTIQGLVELEP